jgi:ABC-type thiamin/hydroxymethylpyrimidine transport system permease subunit
MKAMSILGITFSVIFFLWYLFFLSSSAISKEEFSAVGVLFGLWSISFSIVTVVKAFKNKNK